jgi:phenylpropionate dioxygenase-like ring-hydroxylating dioxygenase large terminal subunit
MKTRFESAGSGAHERPGVIGGEGPLPENVDTYYTALSRFWHPVVRSQSVSAELPVPARLLGRQIVIARLGGDVVAFDDVCCHLQAKLSEGRIETLQLDGDERIVLRCGYHGWAFNRTGACVDIPQLCDRGRIPPGARINSYPTVEKNGLIWVCLTSNAEQKLPEIPEFADPDLTLTEVGHTPNWEASLTRTVLISIDDYHLSWVHEGVLGFATNRAAPTRTVTHVSADHLCSTFSILQPANISNTADPSNGAISPVTYETHLLPPGIVRMRKLTEGSGIYTLLFFFSPVEWNRTDMFWCVARNYSVGQENEEVVLALEEKIQNQDREMVSALRPWAHPPTLIKGIDDVLIWYLSWMRRSNVPIEL